MARHPSYFTRFENHPSGASAVSDDDVANAARARDLGMSRDEFIAHMQSDFEVIRAFPPEMRWFAENDSDEQFLLNAARDVFDHPAAPESHARRFVRACLTRTDV